MIKTNIVKLIFFKFVALLINSIIIMQFPLMIGVPQVILIIVALLIIFGGKKIPELMKGLGSGIKEFKNAAKDDDAPSKNEEKK